jgi:hypothetical protein
LTEILPDFIHPVLQVSHRTLLKRSVDNSKVERYRPETS